MEMICKNYVIVFDDLSEGDTSIQYFLIHMGTTDTTCTCETSQVSDILPVKQSQNGPSTASNSKHCSGNMFFKADVRPLLTQSDISVTVLGPLQKVYFVFRPTLRQINSQTFLYDLLFGHL